MEKKIINKFMVACGSKLNKENLFGQKRIHESIEKNGRSCPTIPILGE